MIYLYSIILNDLLEYHDTKVLTDPTRKLISTQTHFSSHRNSDMKVYVYNILHDESSRSSVDRENFYTILTKHEKNIRYAVAT